MAIAERSVTAYIPTRGDLDLTHLVDHLRSYPEFAGIHVLGPENPDSPFKRYREAMLSPTELVYVQDDDVQADLTPMFEMFSKLLKTTPSVPMMVNNMTQQHQKHYPNRRFTLVGFGSLFHRDALAVFDGYARDALFYRESDRIMGSVPYASVFPRLWISSDASLPNRTWRKPGHQKARFEMERRILNHQPCKKKRTFSF